MGKNEKQPGVRGGANGSSTACHGETAMNMKISLAPINSAHINKRAT
jgi:hypothetical protein